MRRARRSCFDSDKEESAALGDARLGHGLHPLDGTGVAVGRHLALLDEDGFEYLSLPEELLGILGGELLVAGRTFDRGGHDGASVLLGDGGKTGGLGAEGTDAVLALIPCEGTAGTCRIHLVEGEIVPCVDAVALAAVGHDLLLVGIADPGEVDPSVGAFLHVGSECRGIFIVLDLLEEIERVLLAEPVPLLEGLEVGECLLGILDGHDLVEFLEIGEVFLVDHDFDKLEFQCFAGSVLGLHFANGDVYHGPRKLLTVNNSCSDAESVILRGIMIQKATSDVCATFHNFRSGILRYFDLLTHSGAF